jgi:acyl-CoA synthetase (AMP-forming)/AMP-acid ligase II
MMTFGNLTRRNGIHWSDKDAFVEFDRRVTWAELDRRTDALGYAYRAPGVARGDRVAVLSHDAIEVPETFLAATKVGVIRVGINPRLAAAEIASLVEDSEPRPLIYAAEHQRIIDLIRPQLGEMRNPPRWLASPLVTVRSRTMKN